MALPKPRPLATEDIEVLGEVVTVRALSRSEALHVNTAFSKETADEAEVYILSKGASVSEDEARSWLQGADLEAGGLLIDAIVRLTGLGDEDPKAKN